MQIYIAGTGMTQFGELFNRSLRELAYEASMQAIQDSGLQVEQIDAIVVGNMLGDSLSGQGQLGAMVAHSLGVNVDAFRVEAACASGGIAVKRAMDMLKTGDVGTVLVVGVEKMTDHKSHEVTTGLSSAADSEKEAFYGLTFPSLYGLLARRYMYEFGLSAKDRAEVAVKNHFHGARNKKAHFSSEITTDTVLNSSVVAEPLRLFDCSPISDGAAAVLLSREWSGGSTPVRIVGSAVATDSLALEDRTSLTSLSATRNASVKAYEMASVGPEDIDVSEVHDCFTIAEILALEDLGFYKKGEGARGAVSKETYYTGKNPVNTSGGLKSCGHPVGATGLKQLVELTLQLKGEAGSRQVVDPKFGLAHNVGGSGATCAVHIVTNQML